GGAVLEVAVQVGAPRPVGGLPGEQELQRPQAALLHALVAGTVRGGRRGRTRATTAGPHRDQAEQENAATGAPPGEHDGKPSACGTGRDSLRGAGKRGAVGGQGEQRGGGAKGAAGQTVTARPAAVAVLRLVQAGGDELVPLVPVLVAGGPQRFA